MTRAGLLILCSGLHQERNPETQSTAGHRAVTWLQAIVMGALHGVAIPFR